MTTGQDLAKGAAGIALLHLETGNWEAAYRALEEAIADGVTVGAGASLYYGAPALRSFSAHPGSQPSRVPRPSPPPGPRQWHADGWPPPTVASTSACGPPVQSST